jgi:hypothetical protein
MLLFTGPVEALKDAPALAWYGSAAGRYQEPHLVWPEDQAWCLADEVDEEIEFTVGCSEEASRLWLLPCRALDRPVLFSLPLIMAPRCAASGSSSGSRPRTGWR